MYKLPHFVPVHQIQPIYWARSSQELGDLVLRGLTHKSEKSLERKAWLDLIVSQPLEKASERFAEEIQKLAREGNVPRVPAE